MQACLKVHRKQKLRVCVFSINLLALTHGYRVMQKKRKKDSICWITPQLSAMARAEPDGSQGAWNATQVLQKVLETSPTAFSKYISHQPELQLALKWDPGVAGSCCGTTIPAPRFFSLSFHDLAEALCILIICPMFSAFYSLLFFCYKPNSTHSANTELRSQ